MIFLPPFIRIQILFQNLHQMNFLYKMALQFIILFHMSRLFLFENRQSLVLL